MGFVNTSVAILLLSLCSRLYVVRNVNEVKLSSRKAAWCACLLIYSITLPSWVTLRFCIISDNSHFSISISPSCSIDLTKEQSFSNNSAGNTSPVRFYLRSLFYLVLGENVRKNGVFFYGIFFTTFWPIAMVIMYFLRKSLLHKISTMVNDFLLIF